MTPVSRIEETKSPAETESLGSAIGEGLRAGVILALLGPIGAGKTTFVRGLARGLGNVTPVASPTFQLLRIYQGGIPLWHIDLFRLPPGSEEFYTLEALEAREKGVVIAVEWAERAPLHALDGAWRISFDTGANETIRRIRIESP